MMWGEVMEDKSAESVLLAITRLSCSFDAPVQIQVDPDAAEVEVLKEATFFTSVRENLYRHHGIRYEVTPLAATPGLGWWRAGRKPFPDSWAPWT